MDLIPPELDLTKLGTEDLTRVIEADAPVVILLPVGAVEPGAFLTIRTVVSSVIGVASLVHGVVLAIGASGMFGLRSYRIAVAARVLSESITMARSRFPPMILWR